MTRNEVGDWSGHCVLGHINYADVGGMRVVDKKHRRMTYDDGSLRRREAALAER